MTTAMLCTADLNESILTRLDPDLTPPILTVEVTTHNPDGTVELWVGQHQMVLAATHEAIDAVVKHVQPEKLIQQEDPTMTTFDPRPQATSLDVDRDATFMALDHEFIEPGHESRLNADTWYVTTSDSEGTWALFVHHDDGHYVGTIGYHREDDPDKTHLITMEPTRPVTSDEVVQMVGSGLMFILAILSDSVDRSTYYRVPRDGGPLGF